MIVGIAVLAIIISIDASTITSISAAVTYRRSFFGLSAGRAESEIGIDAGDWLTKHWSNAERRALWPGCVVEMEDFERRIGGPVAAIEAVAPDPEDLALGILSAAEGCAAAVKAVERWVIPSLARVGVLPVTDPSP